MAEPSVNGLNGSNIPIPIQTNVPTADIQTVKLVRSVANAGGQLEKRQATLPFLCDERDPELVLRLVRDFEQVYPAGRLNLTTGVLRFEFFRQCLGGVARDNWDSDADGRGNALADFVACRASFILRYMTDTDLADQQTYLDTCKKPYKMTVPEVSARLEFINNLMAYFPGAGGNAPYDGNALKYKLSR